MRNNLYPIKFEPKFVEKVWGGNKLCTVLNKPCDPKKKIGESWEISAIQDNLSIVKNGFLEGNNIEEVLEIYMSDILGYPVYMKYGIEFPLLVKFIDANDLLSVQVHPDDHLARYRHYAYGKTEMWYVIDAEPGAELIMGWKHDMDRGTLLKSLEDGTITEHLNYEKVKPGDVFFIPAGRVHALGKGIVVAEIQQTSDITYRLYDWGRVGLDGKPRELHIDLALDAIDYNAYSNYRTEYTINENGTTPLVNCDYFTTNLISFDQTIEKNYLALDSFVIYICLEGKFKLEYHNKDFEILEKGETAMLPAEYEEVRLIPYEKSKVLEVYIERIDLNVDSRITSMLSGMKPDNE